MGGTFNPIHNGHLIIAKNAYKQFDLDIIYFMPAKNPPHKRNLRIALDKDRLEMVRLAIAPYDFFELSLIEMNREGFSYTSDTLKELKLKFPNSLFYFIIGADSLHYLDQWHQPEIIFNLSHILCAPRYPTSLEEDYLSSERLMKTYNGAIDFINMQSINISSSMIVKDLSKNNQIEQMLPNPVYRYIKQNELYKNIDLAMEEN